MTLTIEVDPDVCSAHGDCEQIAPEVFRLGDVAEVIGTGPDDLVAEAARACPAAAIRLVAPDGSQVYP